MVTRPWLLLTYKVPPEPAAKRVALWRRLKGMGAVYLQNGVCQLPKTDDHVRRLKMLENDITEMGRVGMWRGGVRSTISVAAPFVWRCLSGSAITPFPYPAHRTQQADFPHCALGQDLTPSPTTGRGRAGSDVRARSTRRGARVDSSRACVACPCA